jgi:hypothetical protein
MIKLQQATENLNAIFDNKDLLDVLIDVEDVFDGLDLYAFANWIDGLVVSGPHVSRYWINVKLMYLHKNMPDPTGAQRLERHGCKIKYEKTHFEQVKKVSPDDMEVRRDPAHPTTFNKTRAKKYKIPVWIVDIDLPKQFVDDFVSDTIWINGISVDVDDIDIDTKKDDTDQPTPQQQGVGDMAAQAQVPGVAI